MIMQTAWLKALELNPGDSQVLHGLGMWCYNISGWSWIQRKVACAVFEAPPESSYQEALKYFLEAESRSPRSSAENVLIIAKCYLKMQKTSQAREYLEDCVGIIDDSYDAENAKSEASEILESLRKS